MFNILNYTHSKMFYLLCFFNVWPTELLLFFQCYRELTILQILGFRGADSHLRGRESENFLSMVSARGDGGGGPKFYRQLICERPLHSSG